MIDHYSHNKTTLVYINVVSQARPIPRERVWLHAIH